MDTHTLPLPLLHAAWRAALRLHRRVADTLRAHREARATRVALSGLDAQTLRDLGLVRSETGSIAAEAAGLAQRTRRRFDHEHSPW